MTHARTVAALTGVSPDRIPWDDLVGGGRPVVMKGLARGWPIVREGLASPERAMDYLRSFYDGKPVVVFTGAPEIGGRFHYDMSDPAGGARMSFRAERAQLDIVLAQIRSALGARDAPSFYVGSTDVDVYLPGFRIENDLALDHPMFAASPPLVGAWIGNRTVAAAHYDISYNAACCLVGRRRFTLFPPAAAADLYPGPLEPTPGGQVVSMVDPAAPDLERFPRFREALEAAQAADLEPGDVLYYPALWWHQVEALEPFNVMVNYWWNLAPAFVDSPQTTLLHGILSLRDRPEAEKLAWRALFDYYVFGDRERSGAHLPEAMRGPLRSPLSEAEARRLRAKVARALNR